MQGRLRRFWWDGLAYVGVALGVAALGFWFWAGQPGLGRADRERSRRGETARSIEEALSTGRIPNHRLFTRVWLPRAALINGCLALGLAAAWPMVRRRLSDGAPVGGDDPASRPGRAGWCGMALVAAVATWANAPRLSHSLWGDEENTLRRAVVGTFSTGADGRPVFQPVSWEDTLFYYRDPNNHVLFSLAARASHTLFARAPVAALDTYFSEWALRLPAVVAGGLAVLSLAGLGAAIGWRRAGWVAAVLLVLHPWFVRYSTEARGYAFLLAGFPALLTSLLLATRTGRWRWWAAAAAVECALLYTWPLSLHAVAAANLSALGLVWWRSPWARADRITLTARWLATTAAAAMLYLQLFLPHLIQLSAYLRRPRAMGSIDDGGVFDAVAALLTGRVWQDPDPANPLLTPWLRVWQAQPAVVVVAAAALVAVLAAGVVRAWRETRESRVLLVGLAAPPVLMLGHSVLSHSLLLPWYLVPCLPGLLLLTAGGLDGIAARFGGKPASAAVMAAAGCALFGLVGAVQRERLRRHPIEPNREAALLVQPVLNPLHPDYHRTVLTGGFLMQISAYDPGVREFKDEAMLQRYLDEADGSGRDFAVTYGQALLARQRFPGIMRLLDDPRVFQHVASLPGLEPFCTRHIYRHRASASRTAPALNENADSASPR